MTTHEQIQELLNSSASLHRDTLREAEETLAAQDAVRPLTYEEVEHYRLAAKVVTLSQAVLVLADELDRLKGSD
jgi:hypothetical protein